MKTPALFLPLLFLAPLAGEEPLLKSAITVERGVYEQGWEYDFFRELRAVEREEELPDDAVPATPDDTAPRAGTGDGRPPKSPEPPLHAAPPRPVEEPAPPPPAPEPPPVAPKPPPEEEPAPEPPPRRPAPPEKRQPQEREERDAYAPESRGATPEPDGVDPEKRRQDRLRELEKKRKKRNFRDPKITY